MQNKAKKGQGVVEYAGALVIAAAIVGAVLTAGPDNLATMFNNVINSVGNYLTDTAGNIGTTSTTNN